MDLRDVLNTNFPHGTTEYSVALEAGLFDQLKKSTRKLIGATSDGLGSELGGIHIETFNARFDATLGDRAWLAQRQVSKNAKVTIEAGGQFLHRDGRLVTNPLKAISEDFAEIEKQLPELIRNTDVYYTALVEAINNYKDIDTLTERLESLTRPVDVYKDTYRFLGCASDRSLKSTHGFSVMAFRQTKLPDEVSVPPLSAAQLPHAVALIKKMRISYQRLSKNQDTLVAKIRKINPRKLEQVEADNKSFPLYNYFDPAGLNGVSVLVNLVWHLTTTLFRYTYESTELKTDKE